MTQPSQPIAIVVFSESGLAVARKIRAALPGAAIHGFDKRVSACDESFADTAVHLRRLFESGTCIIGVCAAGILVRALAPCLSDKWAEPPVLAVAQDGSVAVPILGGHHGANRLARRLSQVLDGAAGVTTAGDVRFDIAFDEPPRGWRVANPLVSKEVAGRLLSGLPVTLTVEAGDAAWLADCGAPFADDAPARIVVTDRAVVGDDATLARADAVVGYKRYLDLVADVFAGKPHHMSGMTREEVRVTKALAGAPMGHDFCLISLSYLLTDRRTIETRLKAAALGDFIVAPYNPVSRRRHSQIERARDILLTGRPGTTPVVIARNVGRDDHSLSVTTLAELTPDDADMLSMVIIGNQTTRAFDLAGRTWVYSPRGYAKKL